MILRDTVTAVARTTQDVIATMPAQFGTRTVGIELWGGGYRQIEQLYVMTRPGFEWDVTKHRVRYRGQMYVVTGVAWRRRNGRDHHCTVDIEREGTPV